MSDFDTYLAAHAMTERDEELVRAALKTISQLRDAGLTHDDDYRLAPTFGRRTDPAPRQTLAVLRDTFCK